MDELEEAIKESDRVEQLDALIDILVVTLVPLERVILKEKVHGKK